MAAWWKNGKGSSRPPSAPGLGASRPKSALSGATQRATDRRLGDSRTPSRPASAPALLRNDNFPQRTIHKDQFLQGIEDSSVKRNKTNLRVEQFTLKDFMASVDMLQDPYLHDLLVLHNRSQRVRGGAGGDKHRRANMLGTSEESNRHGVRFANRHRRTVSESRAQARGGSPQQRKTQSGSLGLSFLASSATEQVKELCQILDGSIQQHCISQGVPEDLGIYTVPQAAPTASSAFVADSLRGLWRGSSPMQLR